MRAVGILGAVAAFAFTAHPAGAGPEALSEAGRGHATVRADGELVDVEGVAGTVRLAGIQIPDARAGRGDDPAAFEASAYARLTNLVANHTVSVHTLPLATDRNGHTLAHLIRDDGVWIEAELVRAGLARVAPTTDTDMAAADLIALEDDARTHGRGLWADAAFAIRTADDQRLDHDSGSYQIVEGRVVSAARRGDTTYLDFGPDYRTDFTVTIPRASLPAFTAAGMKPLNLSGQQVRVRGWVTRYRGPAMELTTPVALQVLK